MKTYIKAGLAAAIFSMTLSSCIKSYEDYNTNPDAVQVVDVIHHDNGDGRAHPVQRRGGQ